MPTYEYKCSFCNYEFEKFQSIKDDPITVCPDCGGETKRLISSGAGIIFKGSGFYETDYKRSSGNGTKQNHSGTVAKTSEPKSTDKKNKN